MDKLNRPYSKNESLRQISIGFFSGATLLFTVSIFFVLSACAINQRTALPPIPSPPEVEATNGQLVWIDLITEDIAAASSFYGQLFGWRAEKSKQNRDYYLFYLHDKPVGGMVETDNRDPSEPESLWMLSMSVTDLDQVLAIAKERGGKVLEGPMNVEGRGRMALISDLAGAPVILYEGLGESRKAREVESGNWIWTDLITGNRQQAMAFYGNLVGFHAERIAVGKKHTYELLKRDGRTFAGLVELDWEGLIDNWLPYFKVENLSRTIEQARKLGGYLILETGEVAVLIDPTGAAFGIQIQ